MKESTKITWIVIGAVALAALLWLAFRPTAKDSVSLETDTVKKIDISSSVTATGTVEPVTEVEVGTQVSGIIDKLYADYNDVVKAGQVIAEMDKVTLQAELKSATATLGSAKTESDYRTKEYNRIKTLHDKELVSDSEYDEALYQYESAKNALIQAQASYDKAVRNLSYTTITSPIDGVVISRAVEEGQTVAAGFETPTLFTIAQDLTDMQVIADVDEADIGQVSVGQRVSFTVGEGEFVTIMGKSGSGKSTLLNILGCLDTASQGDYFLDGVSVRDMDKNQRAILRNRKIGFVFQNYNLLPKTTAIENVELPLMYNNKYTRDQRYARSVEALKAVGLGDRLEHKSNQMSGGQMQRVAIARALVNDPAMILADEATGNLDTRTSFEILVLFQKLHAEGRTIIFVTHNPDLEKYSTRTITLRDGKVISDESNKNVLDAADTLRRLPVEND